MPAYTQVNIIKVSSVYFLLNMHASILRPAGSGQQCYISSGPAEIIVLWLFKHLHRILLLYIGVFTMVKA